MSPTQWTFLLGLALASAAAALASSAGSRALFELKMPLPIAGVSLAVLFVLAEQFLLNVEFRRQAHSLTLAGVPMVLGLLLVPPDVFVIARVSAAALAFCWQKPGLDKALYNLSAYAFEAAGDAVLVGLVLKHHHHLDLKTALAVIVLVGLTDQIMSLLVLVLIRLHVGPLSWRDSLEVLLSAGVLTIVTSTFGLAATILLGSGALGIALFLMLIGAGTAGYHGYVSTRRRHQSLTLVHEFVTEGVGAESMQSLAAEQLSHIRQLLRASTAEVMFFDKPEQDESAAASSSALVLRIGEDEQLVVNQRAVEHTDWLVLRALSDDRPFLAARNTRDRNVRRWLIDNEVRDAIVVALPQSSGLSGTLTVSDRLGETATFTDDDLTLLQTLTGHLAVAVRSTRLLERLRFDATHDSLTGLANRAYLSSQLERVIALPEVSAAVFLLDLDRFKEVNDVLGHAVGDRLLIVVGERLLNCLPPTATVARLGGDEFAVLVPDPPSGSAGLSLLGQKMADAIGRPVRFEDALLTPDASIGVSYTSAANPQRELLRQADTAMYQAKASNCRVAVYEPEMDRDRMQRLALLADLRVALSSQTEQFAMHYQPQIDIDSGAVIGLEALIRWNHPTFGMVPPDRFIPIAESTGLIELLTPLVLNLAISQCAAWNADGSKLSVAVNLSARNISDPLLPSRVAHSLAKYGLAPELLILEITESSVMGDPEQTMPVLQQLHELGTCLSLDDFGTGYSSLSYLQRMPVGELKIDRSFVLGLADDEAGHAAALIRSIAALGSNLGLRVVAEGVEDESTLLQLGSLGCVIAQGYFISRPLSAADVQPWLNSAALNQATGPRLRLINGKR